MIYIRELIRCLFITYVAVSIAKQFYLFHAAFASQLFLERTGNGAVGSQTQQSVLHADKSSPSFKVKVNYIFPTSGTKEKASNNDTERIKMPKKNTSDVATTEKSDYDQNQPSHAKMIVPQFDHIPPEPIPIWTKDVKAQMETWGPTNTTIDRIMVGDLIGTIQNGRLVVEVNETYAFWNNGASKLCQLLRDMTLRTALDKDTSRNASLAATFALPTPLLNMTMDCEVLSTQEGLGQGNWITALYIVRMATALARVDYQFQCTTGRDSQKNLLLPWFDGYRPAPTENEPWPFDGEIPTEQEACHDKYRAIRVDKMSREIQKDIRKMALTLVKRPGWVNESIAVTSTSPSQNGPLFPQIHSDEVAIHLRCGDIMGGVMRGRRRDAGRSDDCRAAVYLLVDYLQGIYPDAAIKIHNNANETLPLVYARIATAKQSFTSLTSFGIFPVVGTFGEGYFQKGNAGVNPFASYLPQHLPNLHEMRAPVWSSAQIRKMGLNATLQWFVSQDDA